MWTLKIIVKGTEGHTHTQNNHPCHSSSILLFLREGFCLCECLNAVLFLTVRNAQWCRRQQSRTCCYVLIFYSKGAPHTLGTLYIWQFFLVFFFFKFCGKLFCINVSVFIRALFIVQIIKNLFSTQITLLWLRSSHCRDVEQPRKK